MKNLAERYEFATRIPQNAFQLTVDQNGGKRYYDVKGEINKLPANYCTVDQVCVSEGIWRERFDEERLAYAEHNESLIRNQQQKTHCNCHNPKQ